MRGREGISALGERRESRESAIEPQPHSLTASVTQREEARLGRARAPPIGSNELHRALKVGERYRRIPGRHLLVGTVRDTLARELLPVARPVAAEAAIAVVDQHRPGRAAGRISNAALRISGCRCHESHSNGNRSVATAGSWGRATPFLNTTLTNLVLSYPPAYYDSGDDERAGSVFLRYGSAGCVVHRGGELALEGRRISSGRRAPGLDGARADG